MATDQNAKMAAGQIASQRGINPGQAARLIAQNTAAGNQMAAGQSDVTRMQEQLAARSQLGSALSAQRGEDLSQQQTNLGALGTIGGLNQSQNQLGVQGDLAAQGLNQQTAAQNAQLQMQAQGLNQQTAAQNANLNLGAQQINAGTSAQNANTNAGMVGGAISGIGGAATKIAGFAGGGEIPDYGRIPDYSSGVYAEGGRKLFDALSSLGGGAKAKPAGSTGAGMLSANPFAPGAQPQGSPFAAPWDGAQSLLGGGPFLARGGQVNDFRAGGKVPGRAAVQGDSPRNDTVLAHLSPGEEVLPRSITQAPDAPARAAAFVAELQRRQGAPKSYADVLARTHGLRLAGGGDVPPPIEIDFSQLPSRAEEARRAADPMGGLEPERRAFAPEPSMEEIMAAKHRELGLEPPLVVDRQRQARR